MPNYSYGGGGGGGGGGSGVIAGTGTNLSNSSTITGGNGGGGGSSSGAIDPFTDPSGNGVGGRGGNGFTATGSAGLTITNTGTIKGGGGGSDFQNYQPYRPQPGGVGIIGQNLTIINSGTIAGGALGGAAGVNGALSTAIIITGGTNSITALAGSNIGAIELGGNTTLAGTFNNTIQVNGGIAVSVIGATAAGDVAGITTFNNYGATTIADGRKLSAQTISNAAGTIGIGAGATLQGTGNTLYNNAIINVGAGGSVVDAGAINNQGGGTINFNGPTGTATLSAGQGIYNDGQIKVLGGDVAVTGDISNQNNGTLALTGGNMTGVGTLTNSGTATLNVASGYNLGVGTLSVSGGSVTGTGTITASTAFNLSGGTIGATLAGTAALTKTGAGTAILAGANSYSGGTTINAGTLQLGSGGGLLATSDLSVGTGSFFDLNGQSQGFGKVEGVGEVKLGSGGALTVGNADASSTFDGVISGAGSLTKAGTGTFVLNGANAYTAGTTVSGGTLQLGSLGSLAATGSLGIGAGATFDLNGRTQTIGTLSGAGSLTLGGGGALSVGNGDGSSGFGGVISGDGSLTKLGTGTLTLTGANTYTGGTTISAGTLQLGDGTLDGSIAGSIVNNGMLSFNTAGSISFDGAMTGTGGLAKSGSGTLTLTGAIGSTGATTINAGTLLLGTGGSLASSSAVNITSSTGILDLNGLTQTLGDLAGMGEVKLGSGALTIDKASGSSSFSGVISGSGSLTKSGSSAIVLTGENTYTGGTTISGGTLRIGTGSNTGSIQGDVVNNAQLSFARINDYTFAGDISGSGQVDTAGLGKLILTGNNTHTGGTNVLAGSLQIGDGTTDGSIGGDINVWTNVIFNTVGTRTFAGRVRDGASAHGAFTKTGAGTLTLTGANSYTGGTTISGGTLALGSGGSLYSGGTVNITSSTGILDLAGHAQTLSGLDGTGEVKLGSGALTFNRASGYSDFGGVISGTGSLTKSGSGSLILSGENTYTGGTTISNGWLQIGSSGSTGSIQGNIVNNSALYFGRADDYTFAGDISGSGMVFTAGGGKLILTGNNTYTGDTFVPVGSLQIGDGTTDGSIVGTINVSTNVTFNTVGTRSFAGRVLDGVAASGSFTKDGAGTLTLTGASTYTGGTTINGGALRLGNDSANDGSITGNVVNNGELQFDNLNDAGFGGEISGSGAVRKLGTNTLTLTGANTYAGPSLVNAGTLRLGGNDRLNASGNVTVSSGAVFDLGGYSQGIGELSGAGEVKLGTGGALSAGKNTNSTFTGIVSGAGSLTKTGTGRLTLAGDNTYTGSTTIDAGMLQIGNGLATGSIATDVVNNGTLAFNRSNDYVFTYVITDGSGSGAVEQNGTGRTVLTGTNTYTGGTTVNAGALQIGDGGAAGSILGGVTVSSGAEFAVNRSGVYTLPNAVGGAGSFAQRGSGTTILGDGMTYTGGTVIAAGTLKVGSGGTQGSLGSGNISNAAALVVDKSNSFTIAGAISGTGSFETTGGTGGTGKTTLSGANTYTGATTVSGGALEVSGSLGDTAVSVSSGATLAGGGTIAGAVTIADGGHLAPGANPGTLTTGVLAVGSLNLSSGSMLDFDLGLPNQLTGSDRVDVTGNLVLDGTLNIADAGGFGGGIYRLFTYGGTLTDNGLSIGSLPGGTSASDLSVQTSVAAQVNLVNSAGLTLNFWDGSAAGNANNNLVDGGAGTWNATNGSWTDQNGSVNAPPSATPGFMVFQGSGGTVTVDDGAGAIAVTGMQFAADGYRIEGASIALSGAQAIIRVGDGTSAGAAYTATIASVLTGASDLVKTDLGTLVLTGANTYTGNTVLNSGTLSVSSDANLGDAAAGLVFNGGVLRVTGTSFSSTARAITFDNGGGGFDIADAANSFTVSQALSGNGGLAKLGAGTLVLTGANTYAGGTMISGGTLQIGNGGTSGEIDGNIVNNGRLAVNRSDDVSFSDIVSGTGSLVQMGPGRLTLTGANTYAGGTTIAAGTLQLGDGGTSGSIVGDVTNNGTLAFNRSDAATFAGVVSGSGALKQLGSGTTILTGANSYTGGTVIAAGTLQLGNGGTTGSIAGDVANSGTLAFNRSDAVSFAGIVSGSGALKQIGSGTTTLTGANTYAGGTVISAGTLQLGNGGTSGSIGGDVANDGTLAFNRSDVVSFAGVVSGSGALKQTGSGTTILTGTNSYTGGTTIMAGTLQLGTGGTSGSIAGDITNNGTLAFDRSDAATFAGIISGSGGLNQIGAGTLVLTGANTYAGGTVISAGTLQLGDGGTSGSITGDVLNDGTLAFKRSDEVTFGGAISGTGALKQIGSGTTTLTGVNSYAGGTTISAGTLIGSATSFGSGAILNNAALVIDQPANAVFANAIDGTGSFTKTGAGSLNLTGTSGLTGPTTVAAGRLAVNGSLANSPVTVQSGGTLGGNGTVGTLIVQSGGIVAPGNSIGTITVNGSVTLAPGSIYQVEVDGSGRSDRIVASGAITVSGATLQLATITGTVQPSARYELFSATGGVSGRFSSVTSNFAFLTPNLSYDAAQTYLTIERNDVSFGSVGQTRNQGGAATASEQLGTGNPVYDAVVKLDAPAARAAFDALSGEIHASAKGVLAEESSALRDAATGRLRSAFGAVGAAQMATMNYGFTADLAPSATGPMPRLRSDRFALWGQGYGSWGRSESDRNAGKLTRSSGGLMVGGDVAVFDNLRFGALAGY
ncbi:hypothetical protein DWF00_13000, partial [Bosea caraganae]